MCEKHQVDYSFGSYKGGMPDCMVLPLQPVIHDFKNRRYDKAHKQEIVDLVAGMDRSTSGADHFSEVVEEEGDILDDIRDLDFAMVVLIYAGEKLIAASAVLGPLRNKNRDEFTCVVDAVHRDFRGLGLHTAMIQMRQGWLDEAVTKRIAPLRPLLIAEATGENSTIVAHNYLKRGFRFASGAFEYKQQT